MFVPPKKNLFHGKFRIMRKSFFSIVVLIPRAIWNGAFHLIQILCAFSIPRESKHGTVKTTKIAQNCIWNKFYARVDSLQHEQDPNQEP